MILIQCRICSSSGVDIFNTEHTDICKEDGLCLGPPYCPVIKVAPCKFCRGEGYVSYDYEHVKGKAICLYVGDDYLHKSFELKDKKNKVKEYIESHKSNKKTKSTVLYYLSKRNKTLKLLVKFEASSKKEYYDTLFAALYNANINIYEYKISEVDFRRIVGINNG